MKTTMWTELQAGECAVIKVDERSGNILSVQIRHASLKRPLWFIKSRAGNWYWRNTGKGNNPYADGYIIKGELDGMANAPREHPELAITLDEAERIALDALAQAEQRRQDERKREADFWAAL